MMGEIIVLIIVMFCLGYGPYLIIKGIYGTYLIKTGRSEGQRELAKSWREFDEKQVRKDTVRKIKKEKRLAEAERLIRRNKFEEAINIYDAYGYNEMVKATLRKQAYVREEALDYDSAILIWEELGEIKEAARVRKKLAVQGSVKVAQKIVHGDDVTEIKDSVVSKSNIGSNGDDKLVKLEKIANLKKEGLIDDDEFKQMKKEILGK